MHGSGGGKRILKQRQLPPPRDAGAALGCDDPTNLQDGSRTSSYQQAGYTTYPEAFFRDRPTRSRSRSDGYQQAVRTQQLYDYYDLFTLPQAALGFNAQYDWLADRLAPGKAEPKVDRSIASVTIGTVADEQILEAARGEELVGAPKNASDRAAELTVHSIIKRFTPSLDGKRWISHHMTKCTRSKPARPFLVDNKRLNAEFRERFLRQLKSLHRRGKLELGGTVAELADPTAWNNFIDSLIEKDWCVFIEPP